MLERYPDHPELAYQNATVLEAGNRSRESIALLEKQQKARPDDPQLSNALGFTMADNSVRLPRAEQLVRQHCRCHRTALPSRTVWAGCCSARARCKEALPVLEQCMAQQP